MFKDYFKILGIEPVLEDDYFCLGGEPLCVSGIDIRRTYLKLAHEHHPDKGGNPKKFKEIKEAYEAINETNKLLRFMEFWIKQYYNGPFPSQSNVQTTTRSDEPREASITPGRTGTWVMVMLSVLAIIVMLFVR